ncbi:MAG: PadR family transcriptional regulator [Actinomycetota bacterium]|nr:PadR family transcriptional regulator [Actinomycetota bacterium]
MLELAVLGLLKERSMHGYQLKKSLSETLGPFWQVSYGALYPALKRLSRQGAVEQVFPQTKVGRRRNVYRITDQGEKVFADLLSSSGDHLGDDNGFRVRLAFFRYLKPETRIGVLERRRATLLARLGELRQRITASRAQRPDGYTLSLMRHGMDSTERDITWLDELIEAERRATRKARRARKTTSSPRGARTEEAKR